MSRALLMSRFIVICLMCTVWPWTGSFTVAAEPSTEQSDNTAVSEPSEEPAESDRPRLLKPMAPTPESRRRLQDQAAQNGTDPTAVVGFYQLAYEHHDFEQGHRDHLVLATISLAITPSWVLRATLPYVWDSPNQPGASNENGVSDLTIRMGWMVYHSSRLILSVGADVLFPTASKDRLGLGKYDLGPGFVVSVPMARLRSILSVQPQTFFTLVNNGTRPDTRWARLATTFNTLWSERWWSLVEFDIYHDWDQQGRSGATLEGQVGYQWGDHWRVFAGPGLGMWGRETRGSYDWNVQGGVRWMIPGSIFSRAVFEGFSGD
jgi:hypothetical protein